jgi:hypothetical protein
MTFKVIVLFFENWINDIESKIFTVKRKQLG